MGTVILSYSLMLITALRRLRKERKLDKAEMDEESMTDINMKPVSVLVPAYNEEAGIIDSIHSLLHLQYPQYEIVVINDGSKDGTKESVIDHFQMIPVNRVIPAKLETEEIRMTYQSAIHSNLLLVDKHQGGKADALNAGIKVSRYPYFCSIDGDSILESTALLRVMQPISTSNENVVAAGGSVRIANGSDIQLGSVLHIGLSNSLLVVMQVIEYYRAFLMGRTALSKYNLLLLISGAFSVFSKKEVTEIGGYKKNLIGEDMEIIVRLHRYLKKNKLKKRIEAVPDPVCWTEAPETLKSLRMQRRRWHQGLLESLWSHRGMTFNPRYGSVGLISFPYFWLIECFGPVIEFGGYIFLIWSFFTGGIYLEFSILLALLFLLYGSIFSMTSVVFVAWNLASYPKRKDLLRLFVLSLTEVFWYRPLTVIWRLEGFVRFFFNSHDWGNLERKGLSREGGNQ